MPLKLYVFPVAPNPTKVRLYLAEKAAAGTPIELTEVAVNLTKGEQRDPEHLRRNPMGRLPVLELENGICLTESLSIIEYLEELHPQSPMIGTMPLERARVRELERIADIGVLLSVGYLVHATRSPLGLPPPPEVADYARDSLERNLSRLDDILADGRSFVAGEAVTVADCTLGAALQFARFGEVVIPERFAHLNRWDRSYRRRPAAVSVLVL